MCHFKNSFRQKNENIVVRGKGQRGERRSALHSYCHAALIFDYYVIVISIRTAIGVCLLLQSNCSTKKPHCQYGVASYTIFCEMVLALRGGYVERSYVALPRRLRAAPQSSLPPLKRGHAGQLPPKLNHSPLGRGCNK